MAARDIPTPSPEPNQDGATPPMNRAQRRGQGKKGTAPAGHGKVHGAKFVGPAPRQYQLRKHG